MGRTKEDLERDVVAMPEELGRTGPISARDLAALMRRRTGTNQPTERQVKSTLYRAQARGRVCKSPGTSLWMRAPDGAGPGLFTQTGDVTARLGECVTELLSQRPNVELSERVAMRIASVIRDIRQP